MSSTPILVDVTRGGQVESSHKVHAVVVGPDGIHSQWGDVQRPTMARSAVKSMQLLPLLTTGAATAFAVTDDEIALAASSHGAEPIHIAIVEAWLDRIGLDQSALECGPADPITRGAAHALRSTGAVPSAIHNCCSGKHTGFLTLARHLGVDHRGYLHPDHAVQRHVTRATEVMTATPLAAQAPVIDGCGIPVFRVPLANLASAMQRLGTASSLADPWADAAARVVAALPSRSFLVSGTGRAEHTLTEAANEPIILKGGAEGVFMGSVPGREIGFAMKAEGGAGRAVDAAAAALLFHLGVTDRLVPVNQPIRNRAGTVVGDLVASLG